MQEEYTGRSLEDGHISIPKEIIDTAFLKNDFQVVERVSDYLESFDKLTINSNNQRTHGT